MPFHMNPLGLESFQNYEGIHLMDFIMKGCKDMGTFGQPHLQYSLYDHRSQVIG